MKKKFQTVYSQIASAPLTQKLPPSLSGVSFSAVSYPRNIKVCYKHGTAIHGSARFSLSLLSVGYT